MSISLSSITKSKRTISPKTVIYGDAKLGKSTWASQSEKPIFITTEEGLDALDVSRFPLAKSYSDIIDAIGILYKEDHDFKTVVIDSLDWAETLIWNSVCEDHGVDTIEKVLNGFGKGYLEAASKWRVVLDGLDALREKKGMSVILICHEQIIQITPPDNEPYSTHTLKLHKRATALVSEWADVIAHAALKTFTTTDESGFNKKSTRAVGGERVLKLGKSPAYLAGSRYHMPEELPLNHKAFATELAALTAPTNQPTKGDH